MSSPRLPGHVSVEVAKIGILNSYIPIRNSPLIRDPGLDCFVFSGCGHDLASHSVGDCGNLLFGEPIEGPTLRELGRL